METSQWSQSGVDRSDAHVDLGEALDTLLGIQWTLRGTFPTANDLPPSATQGVAQVKTAVDGAIASVKALLRERGVPI